MGLGHWEYTYDLGKLVDRDTSTHTIFGGFMVMTTQKFGIADKRARSNVVSFSHKASSSLGSPQICQNHPPRS